MADGDDHPPWFHVKQVSTDRDHLRCAGCDSPMVSPRAPAAQEGERGEHDGGRLGAQRRDGQPGRVSKIILMDRSVCPRAFHVKQVSGEWWGGVMGRGVDMRLSASRACSCVARALVSPVAGWGMTWDTEKRGCI